MGWNGSTLSRHLVTPAHVKTRRGATALGASGQTQSALPCRPGNSLVAQGEVSSSRNGRTRQVFFTAAHLFLPGGAIFLSRPVTGRTRPGYFMTFFLQYKKCDRTEGPPTAGDRHAGIIRGMSRIPSHAAGDRDGPAGRTAEDKPAAPPASLRPGKRRRGGRSTAAP